MIQSRDVFTQDPNVIFTPLDEGEAILLHLETKGYFSLNETGILIWHLLGEGKDVGQIAESVAATYEITPQEAEGHVGAFLEELRKDGLVRRLNG